MRSFNRVADAAFVAIVALAGAAIAVAPLLQRGLVLGGSACGGGGEEQRCTGIARQLSLVEVSPRAWSFVVGGALCVALAATAFVLRRSIGARIGIAVAVLILAFAGLVAVERIQPLLDSDDATGTVGRSLEDWGSFLTPALRDLRQDALRRYEGTRTEPGGPLYDAEQILPYFSVREQDGWRYLHGAIVVLFFAALFETSRRLIRRPTLAATTTVTAGVIVWAVIVDRSSICEGSDCWEGVLSMAALALAAIWWIAYLAGTALGRFVEGVRTSRR